MKEDLDIKMKIVVKNLILVFILIIALIFIYFISTFVHEQAHILSAKKQNISFEISEINIIPNISNLSNWGGGNAIPLSKEDCEKFNQLGLENKQKITYAGVYAEIVFISFLLFFPIVLLFIKINSLSKLQKRLLGFFIGGLIGIIINSLLSNAFTSNPLADWNFQNFNNCLDFIK